MAETTNKQILKPAYTDYAADPTGWTSPINGNWDIIDSAFGGTHTVSMSSSNVTLTDTQCQNVRIRLTGTTGASNLSVLFPTGISGLFMVDNVTTGTGTITLASVGAGLYSAVAVRAANTLIWLDASTNSVYLADNSPVTGGVGIGVTGTSIDLDVPVTVANGGTGQTTYTAGQLLIGNNAGGLTPATLIQGSNISITNGNGAITIAATTPATGVTTFSAGTTGFTPNTASGGAISLGGTLSVANGGTGGTTQAAARSGLGLGTMATQTDTNVAISGGVIQGMSVVLVGTNSYITAGIEKVGVLAGTTTNGFASRVSTNTSFNFVGQNSSATTTFSVNGNGKLTALGGLFLDTLTSFTGSNTSSTHSVNSTTVWTCSSSSFTLGTGIDAFKDGGGSWTATSDLRVKKDVVPYSLSTKDILSLRPVSYKYNGEHGTKDNGVSHIGLIAQEVQNTSFASMVGSYDRKGVEILSVDSSQLVFALVNAVKELSARVEALETKQG